MYIVGAVVKMLSQYPCLMTKELNLNCFNGSKVVDGIYTPIGVHEYTSIAITQNQDNPWLQIDLGKSFCISAVKIWNRSAGRRFIKFYLVNDNTAINSYCLNIFFQIIFP